MGLSTVCRRRGRQEAINATEKEVEESETATARALQPAYVVVAIAKLAEEINELDDDSDVGPLMCPFDAFVEEVDEREPHEYAYRIEKHRRR